MSDRSRIQSAWKRHDREWRDNLFVYAVVSRRSHGISVGINLNPDKGCNFDCVYCQVNRNIPPKARKVNLERLTAELDLVLQAEQDGSLYMDSPYDAFEPQDRGIRDIAFSGDGEPTTSPYFTETVRIAAEARNRFGLLSTKLVLITDAAYLHKPGVRKGLALMDENNGEIWAKLDAGTERYFEAVNRPNVTLRKVVENILEASRARPLVIQSLWSKMHGEAPPTHEIEAFAEQLGNISESGGQIKAVQLYTVARTPAERFVAPLSSDEMEAIASRIKARVPVPIEIYG